MAPSQTRTSERSSLRGAITPELGVAAAVLALTVLAAGGIYPTVALLFGLGASATLATAAARWASSEEDGANVFTVPLPYLAIAFAWLALVTLLQTVPLPVGLLRVLSPSAAAVWGDSLRPYGLPGPAFATLSLAPEMTRVEAVKWAGYAALAWAGHRAGRRAITSVGTLVLALALLVALVTLIHGLTGATKLYGFYETFVGYPRWRMGPLLNANHLSGYLNFGIMAALGLLFSSRTTSQVVRAFLVLAIGSLAGAVVLLGSRGAWAVLAVSLIVGIGVQAARARSEGNAAGGRTALVLLGIVGLAVALPLVGYERAIREALTHKTFSKLQVAKDSVALIADYPLVGVGRGAFEGAYFHYRTIWTWSVWTHPENILVQWLCEWGLLGTSGGLVFLWLAVRRVRLARLPTVGRFLGGGLVALVVHNFVDFSLELPGVMGLCAYAAGAVLGSASSGTRALRVPARSPQVLAGALVLLVVLAARGRPELESIARQHAFDAAKTEPPNALQPFLSRFPADPYFPLYGAFAAGRLEPLRAMPFHNQVLQCAPHWSTAHLALAEDLFRAGHRSQALLEVRVALTHEADAVGTGSAAAIRYARSFEELAEAAPEGVTGILFLRRVVDQLPPGPARSEARAAVLDRDPCQPPLVEEVARELTQAIIQGQPPCDGSARAGCVERVAASALKMDRCASGGSTGAYLRAELAWAKGEREVSVLLLEKVCETRLDSSACLRTLADRAISTRRRDVLGRAVRRITARECDGPARCAAAWGWAAEKYSAGGEDIAAFAAATRATTEAPSELSYHWLRVGCAEKLDALPKVVLSLETILARTPEDTRARALLTKARTGR